MKNRTIKKRILKLLDNDRFDEFMCTKRKNNK